MVLRIWLHQLNQNLWGKGPSHQCFLKALNDFTMQVGLRITGFSEAVNGFLLEATALEASPPADFSLHHPE